MSRLPGLPEHLAGADLSDGAAQVTVDATVYPLDAIYGASFAFIGRCFVFVDRPDGGHFRVLLAPKTPGADEAELRDLVGEFGNELLSSAFRQQVTRDNRSAIEAVTTQAIGGAMGPPSLDELEDFDFSEEPFDDPLGIAQSWEEKYGKKEAGPRDATSDSEES